MVDPILADAIAEEISDLWRALMRIHAQDPAAGWNDSVWTDPMFDTPVVRPVPIPKPNHPAEDLCRVLTHIMNQKKAGKSDFELMLEEI